MTLFRYALITTFALSAALVGCGDDDPPVEGNNDGGTGGSDAGSGSIDAGDPAELPALDSQECADAEGAGYTPYDEADCETREDEMGDAVCGSCWSQSPAEKAGNCAGFYCNWTEVQVQCQMDRPLGACNTEADLELGCDSSIQNSVAECARDAQGMVISAGITQEEAREVTEECAREELPRVVSEACLDCYVDSAECARDNCLGACLSGDSIECDECREEAECTPTFFACTGFPDPQKLNPDGTSR